jgi:glycosyltransferase involved in cell wall biosynthesis
MLRRGMKRGGGRFVAIGHNGVLALELAGVARALGMNAYTLAPDLYGPQATPECATVSIAQARLINAADGAFTDIWLLAPEQRFNRDRFIQGPLFWAALRLKALLGDDAAFAARSADLLGLLHFKAVVAKTTAPQYLAWRGSDLAAGAAGRTISTAEMAGFERALAFDDFVLALRALAQAPLNPPFTAALIDLYAKTDAGFAARVSAMRADRSLHDLGLEAPERARTDFGLLPSAPPSLASGLKPVIPVLRQALRAADLVATEASTAMYPYLAGVKCAVFHPPLRNDPPRQDDPFSALQHDGLSNAQFMFRADGAWRGPMHWDQPQGPDAAAPAWRPFLSGLTAENAMPSFRTGFEHLAGQDLPVTTRPRPEPPNQPGPLRPGATVLHVTNVANNAFLNASLLWEAGYPSFIAHHDMYHFASQPEWFTFDSDRFSRDDLGDHFFSNWWRMPPELRTRPKWFAEGPQHLVLAYLRFVRGGHTAWAQAAWDGLEYQRLKAVTEKNTLPHSFAWSAARLEEALHGLLLTDAERAAFRAQQEVDDLLQEVRETAVLTSGPAGMSLAPPFPPGFLDVYFAANAALARRVRSARARGFTLTSGLESPPWMAQVTPQKPAGLRDQDWLPYAMVAPWWQSTMAMFDIVMGYGAGPNLCYLAGQRHYGAYEHGTIRSLPFADDAQGRLLKLSYQAADAVFITNNDYISASPRLEFAPEQRYYVPHVFDERPLRAFSEAEGGRNMQATPVQFFAPARHDWRAGGQLAKGNDRIIHAIADIARDGAPFEVTFVDWGPDADATRALITALGVERFVRWIAPVPKKQLWRLYLSCNALIDQMCLPSLSGVLFEAMVLGARCITRDDGENGAFFGEAPPLLPAETAAHIAARMRQVLADPLDEAGIGAQAIAWMMRHHSGARFLERELEAFAKIKLADDEDRRRLKI